MCLILLAHRSHPRFPLVLAANRDEFHDRPAAPLAEWDEAPGVFAGRDLKAGGTWLGATTTDRWVAVTNVREPGREVAAALSRGELVKNYLVGNAAPDAYLDEIAARGERYNGFNLLVGYRDEIWYLSNRGETMGPHRVTPGIHGLSNAGLDTPWPKVARGRKGLETVLGRIPTVAETGADGMRPEEALAHELLALLADRTVPLDTELPDTGVGLELERILSPALIATEGYGTRCSNALIRATDGCVTFVERSFAPDAAPPRRTSPEVLDEKWVRFRV